MEDWSMRAEQFRVLAWEDLERQDGELSRY